MVVDGEVSSWKQVLSGVPQGSVLGPILFLVYINDLEEGVSGKILKFADDTKLFRKVKEIGDKQNLQDDIDKLVKWSEKWQMLFNFGKCKCLHTGSGNTGMNYEMGGNILSKTLKEKDLGVTMNANMKVSEQCRIAASKGNQVLGMIRRNIYIYIGECVCVCVSFWAYTRRRLWSDRDQIRHTHGDSSRNGNGRNKNYPV